MGAPPLRERRMAKARLAALLILQMSFLVDSSVTAASAEDTRGVAFKIQIGGHRLTQETGIVPGDISDSTEDTSGPIASLTLLGKDRGRTPYGVCMELEGNRVEVGPEVQGVGVQTFGIATVRVMGQLEFRLRGPQQDPGASWQPFLLLGAGWNFHSVGSKIEWPVAPPPAGTPRSLELDGSPALRLGAGFHSKGTQGGLSFNLEGGWKWDAGDYTMRVQGQSDRRGAYDLSGGYALIGITLRFRT
jgi:hypothetical protein